MDTGNTAFLIICTALVLMMTPALAFFYGGLVRAKSVISMMMLSARSSKLTMISAKLSRTNLTLPGGASLAISDTVATATCYPR